MRIHISWAACSIQILGFILLSYLFPSSFLACLAGGLVVWGSYQASILHETYKNVQRMKEYQRMGEECSRQYKEHLAEHPEDGDLWEDVYQTEEESGFVASPAYPETERKDLANLDECFPKEKENS